LPKNSTKQPRFGAFFVSVGRRAAEGAKRDTAGIYDTAAATPQQNNFDRWEKGCIFAAPKSIGSSPQRAVVAMAILPLYGGGTGNSHTATN